MKKNTNVIDRDDLVQSGLIGILNGLKTYDPKKARGFKKTTYILKCIRAEMMEEANKFYGPFRLPHEKKLSLNKLCKLLNKQYSKEDIKKSLSLSEKEYEEILSIIKSCSSIQNIEECLLPAKTTKASIDDTINNLPLSKEEIELLKYRIDGYTYSEIASFMNSHKETVRNKFLKLLSKIKTSTKVK